MFFETIFFPTFQELISLPSFPNPFLPYLWNKSATSLGALSDAKRLSQSSVGLDPSWSSEVEVGDTSLGIGSSTKYICSWMTRSNRRRYMMATQYCCRNSFDGVMVYRGRVEESSDSNVGRSMPGTCDLKSASSSLKLTKFEQPCIRKPLYRIVPSLHTEHLLLHFSDRWNGIDVSSMDGVNKFCLSPVNQMSGEAINLCQRAIQQ